LPQPEELASFSSDIDVIHSGKTEDTVAITSALIASIPFGESIRWQVKSSKENSVFEASLPFNGVIPVNLMSLSTFGTWGVKDEWHGTNDIETGKYRYLRNGFYSDSPLFKMGRDVELFSALLYFKALVEDISFKSRNELDAQPGLSEAKTVVHASCSSNALLMSLQESSYLRARLLYLLKDLRSRELVRSQWKEDVPLFGLDRLVEYLKDDAMFGLGGQVSRLFEDGGSIVISARLGGDQYRLPHTTEGWRIGGSSSPNFKTKVATTPETSATAPSVVLSDDQFLLAESPSIPITSGKSTSSQIGDTIHEFFHMAIPIARRGSNGIPVSASDLSLLLEISPSSDDSRTPVLLSVPNVCSMEFEGSEGMLYVRSNALGFLEYAKQITNSSADDEMLLRTFIVQNSAYSSSENDSSVGETSAEAEPAQSGDKSGPSLVGVIIFVHGILSSSETCFPEMFDSFSRDQRFEQYRLEQFDYDYNDRMEESGDALADFIDEVAGDLPVTLVCHSMGGLVARLALLSGEVDEVKRIIMLATPNFGAIRTAQLGLLSQLAMHISGKIYAVFRKPGIRDLTRVTEVFREPILQGRGHADAVEYVTIPGEFFHEARTFWDVGKEDQKLWTSGFAALNMTTELIMAAPLWRVALRKPHDGIVEAVSNGLIPCGAGRMSEKCGTINDPARFGRTYAHVNHERCSELTHVAIQHDDEIINLVKNLCAASSIVSWHEGLTKEESRRIAVVFH
jgi:pimeloyl-ACP methyl ester carboxylesterase